MERWVLLLVRMWRGWAVELELLLEGRWCWMTRRKVRVMGVEFVLVGRWWRRSMRRMAGWWW